MSNLRLAVPALAATLLLLSSPVRADNLSLPEGSYQCSAFMPDYIYAGELQVEGSRYRGPSLDGAFDLGWIDFDSDEAGNVFLIGKPFGGFTGMGFVVTAAVVDTDSAGNVLLQTSIKSDSGSNFTVECNLK